MESVAVMNTTEDTAESSDNSLLTPRVWSCRRCGYETPFKQCLVQHLQKKKICRPILEDADRGAHLKELLTRPPRKTYTCDGCGKNWQDISNFKRHKAACNRRRGVGANVNSTDVFTQLEEMRETIKQLQEELQQQRSGATVHNVTNTNNTNNNTVNVTNNYLQVRCFPFGSECVDHISPDDLSKYLLSMESGFTSLVKRIHFDNEQPMNNNVRYKSKKQGLIEVFEGQQDEAGCVQGRWVEHDAAWVLDKIISKGHRMLTTHMFNTRLSLFDQEEMERNETIRAFLAEIGSRKGNKFYGIKREIFVIIKDHTTLCLMDSDTQGVNPPALQSGQSDASHVTQ